MGRPGAPAGRHRRTRDRDRSAFGHPAGLPLTRRRRPWTTGVRVVALVVGALALSPLQPAQRPADPGPAAERVTPRAAVPAATPAPAPAARALRAPVTTARPAVPHTMPSTVTRTAAWAEAKPNQRLNDLWNEYGDAGGHWTGGDCGASVPLPDGRIAWLFCDTFLGTVNADNSRSRRTPMVRNSIVIQDRNALTTRHGGSSRRPESLLGPTHGGVGSAMFWPADGTVAGGRLLAFYTQMTRTGRGSLDYRPAGTAVAGFTLPDLEPTGYRILPLNPRVSWGMAVLDEPDYTYVYGVEEAPSGKYLHLARVKPGDLLGAWEFSTATGGWSPEETRSARLMSGVGHGFSVDRVGGRYVLVTVDSNIAFSPHIVTYSANSPAGPFSDQAYLYRAPEVALGRSRIAYGARLHPELGTPDRLVLSYNVNDLDVPGVFADVRVYRPRFLDVTPLPERPDPAALPAAPGKLTAERRPGGEHLSWTGPGPPTWYWLYRRDITSGHQSFSRLSLPVTDRTSADLAHIPDGHTYEYMVAAVNATGEGPPSNVVRVTTARAKRPS